MRTHNLPESLSSFVGRQNEIAQLERLLSTARLVTLAGPGGIGKTRLAEHLARRVAQDYPDGVWLVELASLSDPTLADQAVAEVLGRGERPGSTALERAITAVGDKHLLLLLDNCEHLLDACASLAGVMLRACANMRVLATSRAPLGLTGEVTFRVPSLSTPDRRVPLTPEGLLRSDAARLFIDRVLLRQPNFKVTERNATPIAEACRRLDGIPLALELAAAHVPPLGAEGMLRQLDDLFQLLVGSDHTAPSRHHTLRATIDWSYALLDPAERGLLDRLSVFAGPCTLDAVEAVCGGNLHDLEELIGKSQIVAETDASGSVSYHLLETVRTYAAERLAAGGERASMRHKHAAYFTQLAERAAPQLNGASQVSWLEHLEQVHDNLRLALEWALEHDLQLGLRLATALGRFWGVRGHLTEGGSWLDRLLQQSSEMTDPRLRANALTAAGILAWHRGETDQAEAYLRACLALPRDGRADVDDARPLYELAKVMIQRGDHASARALGDRALAHWREAGDAWGTAVALNFLGERQREDNQLAAAGRSYAESQRLFEVAGDQRGLAISTQNLGIISIEQGDLSKARRLLERTLPLKLELGDREGVADSLVDLAYLALLGRSAARAVRWCAAAALAHESIGAILPPYEQRLSVRTLERARVELGSTVFAKLWLEGRRLTLEQAVQDALGASESMPASAETRIELTRRQRDVAALVAQGLSNRTIAARLVIAEGTAERHVADILAKLGLSSRVGLAAWAIDHGLRPET